LEGEAANAYPPGFRQGCDADLEVTRQEAVDNTIKRRRTPRRTSASGQAN
jgi:hypothetical protein